MKVTDDVQTAEIKIDPKEDGGSKIIIKADVPDEKDEKVEEKKEEELALRIMKELCANAKADCKIVEKKSDRVKDLEIVVQFSFLAVLVKVFFHQMYGCKSQ